MSRRAEDVSAEACVALGAADRQLQSCPNRELRLGSLAISRALPVKDKRLVGPWCFLDRFGPLFVHRRQADGCGAASTY